MLLAQVYACAISSLCMQIFERGLPQRQNEEVRWRERGGRGKRNLQEMGRVRTGEGSKEILCDDGAAEVVFVHDPAGK